MKRLATIVLAALVTLFAAWHAGREQEVPPPRATHAPSRAVVYERRVRLSPPGRAEVTIPKEARLVFAERVEGREPVTFEVHVVDEFGAAHEVYRHTSSGAWTDASCDLSRFVGQAVELELRAGAGGLFGDPVLVAPSTAPLLPYDVVVIAGAGAGAIAAKGALFARAYPSGLDARFGTRALLSSLPLVDVLRDRGADALAVVRDAAFVEEPLGFPRVVRRDAPAEAATHFVRTHHDARFFLFVEGVDEGGAAAILAELDLSRTIVVATPVFGETPAPLALAGPGIPAGAKIDVRVRSLDVAPTILELSRTPFAWSGGRSLVALARGAQEPDERVILAEGPGTKRLVHGRHAFVTREAPAREALFDLEGDPNVDVASAKPEVLAEMRARLEAAVAGVPVAGSHAARSAEERRPRVRLRFSGAGAARRVSGTIAVRGGDVASAQGVGLGPEALRVDGAKIDLAFTTAPDAVVGIDLELEPPSATVSWDLFLDDAAWPEDATFAGPYGLPGGAAGEEAYGSALPAIDPRSDLGLFVVREMVTP